jgi:hypothetical protein
MRRRLRELRAAGADGEALARVLEAGGAAGVAGATAGAPARRAGGDGSPGGAGTAGGAGATGSADSGGTGVGAVPVPEESPVAAIREAIGDGVTASPLLLWALLASTLALAGVAWMRLRSPRTRATPVD